MIFCHEVIWTNPPIVSTYCMRERGHEGEHNIENCEPVKNTDLTTAQTKEGE